MADFIEKLSKCVLTALLLICFAFCLSDSLADDGVEDIPLAPSDPDISDVCTLSDCNPANPCPDPDESCYTLNGVFYCCTSAPDGGMEAVGD